MYVLCNIARTKHRHCSRRGFGLWTKNVLNSRLQKQSNKWIFYLNIIADDGVEENLKNRRSNSAGEEDSYAEVRDYAPSHATPPIHNWWLLEKNCFTEKIFVGKKWRKIREFLSVGNKICIINFIELRKLKIFILSPISWNFFFVLLYGSLSHFYTEYCESKAIQDKNS